MKLASGPLPLLIVVALAVLYVSPSMAYLTYDAPKEFILLVGAAGLLAERLWRRRARIREDRPRVDPTVVILGLLLLLTIVAAFRAYDGARAARRVGVLLAGAVLLIEARLRFRRPGSLPVLLATLTGVGALVGLYGILQFFDLEPFSAIESDGRPVSTLGNPNFAGTMLILLVPAAAALAFRLRGKPRLLALAGLVLMLVHLAVTKNRSGYLGLVAACTLVGGLWAAGRLSRPILRRAVLVIAALAPAAAGLAITAELLPALGRSDTVRIRALIWKHTGELVAEQPVLGQGLGDFIAEYPRVRPREEYRLSLHRDVGTPHSDPLEFAVDAGVPAALLWLALLATTMVAGVRRLGSERDEDRPYVIGLLGGILALATAGLFTSPLSHPGHVAVFFVLLGAVLRSPEAGSPSRSVPAFAGLAGQAIVVIGLLVIAWFSYGHLRCELARHRASRSLGEPNSLRLIARDVEAALAWSPRDVDTLYLAGRVKLKEASVAGGGNYPDERDQAEFVAAARERFERILEYRPYDVKALTSLGRLAYLTEDYRAGFEWFKRGMRVNPDYTPLLRHFADAQSLMGHHRDAVNLLHHALNVSRELKDGGLEPANVYPVFIIALVTAGDVPDAVERTKEYVARLRELDRADEVGPRLSRIVDKAKPLAPHVREVALRWAREMRFEEAEPLLAALVRSRTATGEVWSALETIAREHGEDERARGYLVKAKLVYAEDAVRDDDLAMAERHLAIAEARGAPEYEVLFVRTLILVRGKKLAEALETLTRAAEAGFWDLDRVAANEVLLDPIIGGTPWKKAMIRIQENRDG